MSFNIFYFYSAPDLGHLCLANIFGRLCPEKLVKRYEIYSKLTIKTPE